MSDPANPPQPAQAPYNDPNAVPVPLPPDQEPYDDDTEADQNPGP
jgi:hypothetical protein